MPIKDGYPILLVKGLKTDTASTDAAIVAVPFGGVGYSVRRVTVYNSRLSTTGATANGAVASLSVRGGAGGTGTSVVADAALTGLSGNTIALDRTIAATALSPVPADPNLYIRVGTASGVAASIVDVVIEYSALP